MDVKNSIITRRSIRAYQDTPIEDEKLLKVLEAGRLSPSAMNRQEWKFIVVKDKEIRKKLEKAAQGQKFVSQAPVIIIACATAERIMLCGQAASTVDSSIALTSMILAAWEMGLGTCWLGNFNSEEVKEILSIPEDVKVIAMTPLGYPAENPPARSRKALEKIV